ncbi:MAG: hypothetical protein R3E10_18490 [Gemmatimonadota bacterium]
MMKTAPYLLLAALPLALASTLSAQSPREIIERSLELQDARMRGVENFTIVQELNGQEMQQYYEPRDVGSHRVFIPTRTLLGGRTLDLPEEQSNDPFYNYEQWVGNARVIRSESVEGHEAWVIETDALEAMGGAAMPPEAQLREGRVRMFVDKEEYVVRRMEFEGTADIQGQPREMSMTAELGDFRNVEGVLQPFTVLMTVHGAMSDDESAQMRDALAEMEKRLAELPESVRAQVEGQMRAQIEAMRGASGGEGMQIRMQTKEIRVNQGPPGA